MKLTEYQNDVHFLISYFFDVKHTTVAYEASPITKSINIE